MPCVGQLVFCSLLISLCSYVLYISLNYLQKELLGEMSSPVEGSSEEVKEEEEEDKNTNLPLPSPPKYSSLDDTLEASLLQIIEEVGEENIVNELENLVSQNSEKEIQVHATTTTTPSVKNISELMSKHMSRNTEHEHRLEDDLFLLNSDVHNNSSLPVFPHKSTKKLYNGRVEEYPPSCCENSDCPSFSDTDQANDRFFSDHPGVSVSSTSLAEPLMPEIPPHSRWLLLQDRFLPQYHNQKGVSVPSSLHRDSRKKLSQTFSNPPPFSHHSFSPEPHRRIKRRPDSRCRGGSTRSLCHATVPASPWGLPHHRHSSYVKPSRYIGISESDADTLETNV